MALKAPTEDAPTPSESPPVAMCPPEGRVVLHNVPWTQYEALLAALGDDHPSLRMTYFKGTLEIMGTSPRHERIKKVIARLIEMWAVERGASLTGYGSATFRKREAERGLEPDESYVTGELHDAPELAIEVVHTHGGIEKLVVYAGLGVREVWYWEDGVIGLYVLADERYERRTTSTVLPDLNLAQLAEFVTRAVDAPDQTAAVRAYRDALRGG